MNKADEREIVLEILSTRERTHQYSNVLIRRTLDRYADLPAAQRSFIKRLAEGTIEREMELDAVINRHLRDPRQHLKPIVRADLRMAVYEIYYMDSVTDYAAVNEAVALLRRKGFSQYAGFVNAVLRGICRDRKAEGTVTEHNGSSNVVIGGNLRRRDATGDSSLSGAAAAAPAEHTAAGHEEPDAAAARPQPDGAGETPRRKIVIRNASRIVSANAPLSVRYSMPASIVSMWMEDYGEEKTTQLLDAMMEIRPVCIRFDARLQTAEVQDVLGKIAEAGATITPSRWLPYCFQLTHAAHITELPGFAEGRWTVQDESSQMVAFAAGLGGGSAAGKASGLPAAGSDGNTGSRDRINILDLCAAPGGKSMHAASLVPEGTVYSYDLTRAKTERIRENAQRMHLSNMVIGEHDATMYEPDWEGKADVVLCDVPCSGLGVITRKRDIKYNVTPEKIRSLVSLQKKIMKNAVHYCKPGGVLIYSTCTIDKAENERMIAWIQRNSDLVPDALAPYLPGNLPDIHGHYVQLLPSVHGTDGFFIARFRRPE